MHTINELIRNISDGTRAAHAFAVEGRAGDERSSFIDSLAAGLECTSPDDNLRPCGRCPSCLQAAAGTSMDIVRMSKSTGASRTGREIYRTADAAAFIERLSMGSYGRYLIGIIDDADTLSETIQNKLLKTLEEPSPDTVIIMAVTNRDNLLSTVQSRVSFVRLPDYAEAGGNSDGEDDSSEGISAAVSGLAEMFTEHRAAFCEVRSALDKTIRSREDALALLDAVEDRYRDIMLSRSRGEQNGLPSECADAIGEICTARMDIKREMNHSRALKRLYLEIHR